MLTEDILRNDEGLAGLTDAQLAIIAELSRNDENTVIGKRIGEVYRQLDATIAETTGVQRNGDEKTYNYLARAAKHISDGLAEAKVRYEALEKEKATWTDAADGAKALRTELEDTKSRYAELQKRAKEREADFTRQIDGMKIDGALERAMEAVRLNDALPPGVIAVLKKEAAAKIRGEYAPKLSQDGTLLFHGADGNVLNNPDNRLNPYTAEELFTKTFKELGVLKPDTTGGTGGHAGHPGGGGGTLSAARTRVEAQEMIHKALMAKGLTSGSDAYQEEMNRLWRENDISKLPLK